ncbi:copper resistance protein CopC [Bhargavaea ginsengi]|uniref:copper resistance CopC family protein n=1 Tax=Bhargavaea ginsengi TaxID=426757 RepID=UPI002041A134|nr:copper resistance CopC family protein [Bhargavaea ginsengi]MCM3088332.1 copper resistance protein CopC [Bhargavaea ginsengi]
MRKLLLTILFVMILPSGVLAHSHMETSVPEDGATVTEALEEIVLTFSAGIEEGSKLILTGGEGEAEFREMVVEGDRLTGILSAPLPDGEWTLGWEVISEDGHPISGELSFTVAAGITAEEEQPADGNVQEPAGQEESNGEEDASVEEETAVSEETADDVTETADEESGNGMMTGVLIAVVLILIAVIFFSLRKKR